MTCEAVPHPLLSPRVHICTARSAPLCPCRLPKPFFEITYVFSFRHLCPVRWPPLSADGPHVHRCSGLEGWTPEGVSCSRSHPRSAQWLRGVTADIGSAVACPDGRGFISKLRPQRTAATSLIVFSVFLPYFPRRLWVIGILGQKSPPIPWCGNSDKSKNDRERSLGLVNLGRHR